MAYPGCPVQMPYGLPIEPYRTQSGLARDDYLPGRFNGYPENIGVGPGKACEAVEGLFVTLNSDFPEPVGRYLR